MGRVAQFILTPYLSLLAEALPHFSIPYPQGYLTNYRFCLLCHAPFLRESDDTDLGICPRYECWTKRMEASHAAIAKLVDKFRAHVDPSPQKSCLACLTGHCSRCRVQRCSCRKALHVTRIN